MSEELNALRTLKTTQQLFNHVLQKLLKQGEKSHCAVNECGQEIKCAAGHLIAEEYYLPDLESNLSTAPKVNTAIQLSLGRVLTPNEQKLIIRMQIIHDDYNEYRGDFNQYIIQKFAELANQFGLTFPVTE